MFDAYIALTYNWITYLLFFPFIALGLIIFYRIVYSNSIIGKLSSPLIIIVAMCFPVSFFLTYMIDMFIFKENLLGKKISEYGKDKKEDKEEVILEKENGVLKTSLTYDSEKEIKEKETDKNSKSGWIFFGICLIFLIIVILTW